MAEGHGVTEGDDAEGARRLGGRGLRAAEAEAVDVDTVLVEARRQRPAAVGVHHREVVEERDGLPVPVDARRHLEPEDEGEREDQTDEHVAPHG